MPNEIQDINGIDAARLLSYLERIEHLEEEKKALINDIKEVFDETKSANFDIKALKEILKIRKQDENGRQEAEFMVETYRRVLGID